MSHYVIEQNPKLKAMLSATDKNISHEINQKINGVVVGVFMGYSKQQMPLVVFPGNKNTAGINAHTTTIFKPEDTGCQVALLFENGDPEKPMIIGRMQSAPDTSQDTSQANTLPMQAELNGERLQFNAKKEMVFRCGKSSITLTQAGKIILRGKYLLSRSSGVNRIKGGSVQIN